MTVLSSQAVGRLRHDLRTYVNHLQGYGEMILEGLEDAPTPVLEDGVRRLLDAGQVVLAIIQEVLPPGREDLRDTDVSKGLERLRAPADEAEELLAALVLQAEEEGRTEVRDDLVKIRRAIGDMRAFLASDPVLVEVGPAAPAIPAVPAVHEPLPCSAGSSGGETSPVGVGAHILVVDDVESNRDLLRRRLEREGHRVTMASDGLQALDLIASDPPDLVLLDILMPGVDGFEVLQRVKATATGRDLPIIMISSLDEIQSVVRCIEMGAEDFLPKPFDPVLLRARVDASLEKKRYRDQELAYLHNVALVTAAAAAIEAGAFDPAQLESVAQREDALGRLARVFQRMGREVQAREDRLKSQVLQLKIEIDEARKKNQVAEVTETEYFQELQRRAGQLRKRRER